MSNAIAGPGFFLQRGDGTPGNYTTVSEVHDINGPAAKTDITDVTNQSSPGGFEEVIPTIRRSGEITFDINYNPDDATHDNVTGIQADLNNKTLRYWRVTYPVTNKKRTFTGYVIGFQEKAPINGVLTASLTIKITGQLGLA